MFVFVFNLSVNFELPQVSNWINFVFVLSVKFDIPQVSNWIKGNSGMFGYYRVNYDPDNWNALIQQLTANHSVSNFLWLCFDFATTRLK